MELVVVMAVIGVLTLLAAPKFMGYIEEARETNIVHSVRIAENMMDEWLIEHENSFSSLGETVIPQHELVNHVNEKNKLYSEN